MFTATKVQITTYLLGVCLFSISFLVFLNASVSFVVTDIIGQQDGIGNAVGTLGFVDELVAIVACPIWGALSDRVGVQKVSAAGYTIVGIALFVFVQAQNVYPGLLLARMLFSIGAAACTTMVTAILPSVSASLPAEKISGAGGPSSASVSSELTITPARAQQQHAVSRQHSKGSPTRVAGIVGLFTGCGALIALIVFLPMPTYFKNQHISDAQALMDAFYVVGAIAIVVAFACFFGLRRLESEKHKTWYAIWGSKKGDEHQRPGKQVLSYGQLLVLSVRAASQDYRIGLGYLGGFVARASSVGISLFIPLAVNTYFISKGRCKVDPNDPGTIKSQCKEAYVLSSQLTGVSQLVALLCAPLFGYFADRYRRFEIPLLLASACGILGYGAFAGLDSPEPSGEHGSASVFVVVCLLGISQIGAIVCSLGLLGRGIAGLADSETELAITEDSNDSQSTANLDTSDLESTDTTAAGETSALLSNNSAGSNSLTDLKGSIAGTYSFLGGAGILLLTKLGGALFDKHTTAAPFVMMAIFNAVLFIGIIGTNVTRYVQHRQKG